MKYVVMFEDDEAFAGMRARYLPDHLAFLHQNATVIDAAGPLLQADSGQPAGGLWLVDAESENAVRQLVEADPFWPTGLRKKVSILLWKRVFAAGETLIETL